MSEIIVPIVDYLEKLFILPNGKTIVLEPFQRAFLEMAFTPDSRGKLPYRQVVYSMIKKSGKSQIGACIGSWFAFSGIAEPNGEQYCCANDLEQAQGRVYRALRRSIEMEPLLASECIKIGDRCIEKRDGSVIQPLSSDYASAAGANQEVSYWDELWAYTSESSRRLYEEMTPVPTRRNSLRVITTYSGMVGESELLEDIYKRVVRPENRVEVGGFMNYALGEITPLPIYVYEDTIAMWDHEARMPWQTQEFFDAARNQPGFRLSAYLRLYENRWIEAEEGLDIARWDDCVQASINAGYGEPIPPDLSLPLAVGIDASIVKDRTSVVTTFKKDSCIWLGPRRYWQPTSAEPLNFETTIEAYVLELTQRYFVTAVYYDPWQMESTAQRLRQKGLNMVAFPQSQPNTITMTEFMLDNINKRTLRLYPDEELRSEAMQISVKEIPGRGRRFVKLSANKKIDSIIALAMSALACERHCPDLQNLKDQVFGLRLRSPR